MNGIYEALGAPYTKAAADSRRAHARLYDVLRGRTG